MSAGGRPIYPAWHELLRRDAGKRQHRLRNGQALPSWRAGRVAQLQVLEHARGVAAGSGGRDLVDRERARSAGDGPGSSAACGRRAAGNADRLLADTTSNRPVSRRHDVAAAPAATAAADRVSRCASRARAGALRALPGTRRMPSSGLPELCWSFLPRQDRRTRARGWDWLLHRAGGAAEG